MKFDAHSSPCSSDQLNSNLYSKLSNVTNITKLSMQQNIPTDCLVSSIRGKRFSLHSQPEVSFNLKKTVEELKNTLWTTYNNTVASSGDSDLIIQAEDGIREALDMLATSRGMFVINQMGFSNGLLSRFLTRRPVSFDMPTCVSVGSVTNDYMHYIRVTGTVSLVCTGNTAHDLNVKLRLSVISLSSHRLQEALLQQNQPSRTVALASKTNSGLEDDISSCQSEVERKHISKIVPTRARTTYNDSSDTENDDDKERAMLLCEDIHQETSPSKHDQASIATTVRALLDKLHWYGVDAVLPKKRHGCRRNVISKYYVYFMCALVFMPPFACALHACSAAVV